MFKILDGSHMEISFYSQDQDEDEEPFNITLMLDYRVYDIRPKAYSFKEIGKHFIFLIITVLLYK